MTSFSLLGFVAAFLTTAGFLPQAALVIRTRETQGISLLMYSMFTLGIALWLAYGIVTADMPIIIANVITLILAGTILTLTAKDRLAGRK